MSNYSYSFRNDAEIIVSFYFKDTHTKEEQCKKGIHFEHSHSDSGISTDDIPIDTTGYGIIIDNYFEDSIGRLDTIPVVLLISYLNKNNDSLFILGCEVRKQSGYILNYPRNGFGHKNILYDHVSYLGENKKPLPKSTVVWLHKQL